MASSTQAESSAAAENRFLHLKAANVIFTARRPGYAMFIRISIEGQTYESQSFDEGSPVAWHGDVYLSSASRIGVACYRKQIVPKNIFKQKPYAELTVDLNTARIEDGSTRTFADDRQRVSVELAFGQSIERKKVLKLLGEDVSSALAGKVILLDKIGRISDFIEGVIKVGAAFAELNTVAKVVFAVAKVVFKSLQRQHECHEAAVNLAEFLLDKLPVTEIIPENLQNDLIRKSLEKLLDLTKEALDVLNSYANGVTFNRELGAIRDLKMRLTDVSANLTLRLTAQNNVMTQDIKERQETDMLEKLRPVSTARSSEGHNCLEDTRKEVLGDITDWSEERSPSSKLAWLHGFAGSGKSSIAATVCDELEARKMLAGSFFCKRDVPEQREAVRILPSLSFTLCVLCKSYRDCIIKVLQEEPDIASRPVNYQLTKLFLDPFSELQNYSLERPVVFVIDALDECGADDTTRSLIAHCLSQVATLADWLKVFVTSRPLPELERKFSPSRLHRIINLNDLNSDEDIMKYTRACLVELVESHGLDRRWLADEIIKALSYKASGLFIWTSTVTEFVRGQYDQDAAMEMIMAGKDADPTSSLDTLYLAVVRNSRGGSNARNLPLMKAVLGVIHITAKNKPLSVDGLADLMPMTVTKPTLKAIVNDLRSVLYEDSSKGNVIRVCHPSFLDFLESRARCGDYWTNPDELNEMMIVKCLTLMNTMLRFNICGLESSSVANKDVPNLEQRIRERIPESLQYGCLYWVTHLTEANRSAVHRLLENFFGSLQVLHWVEVLSLIGGLRSGLDTLQAIEGVYENEIARDVYKLLSFFHDAINMCTPHLYISALAWVPDESELKRLFYDRFRNQPLISSGRSKGWHPAVCMNSMEDHVLKVVFSPDGRYIAACSRNGTICTYEAKTGLLSMRLTGHSDAVIAISYSPDGRQLVSGSRDCAIRVWDMSTGTAIGEPLVGHTNIIHSVCYSPDGMYIVSRSLDRTVKIWDSVSWSMVRTMDGLSMFGHVVYSPDGCRLACSGLEGIIVWDAHCGDLIGRLKIGEVRCLAYSPNEAYLAAGGTDGSVRMFDGETLAELAVLEGHIGGVFSVAFSPDSSQLLSASADSTMITWDVASKEMIGMPFRAHSAGIYSATYSPDGLYVASGSYDKTVRVWDSRLVSRAELSGAKNLYSIACSPCSEEFAAAGLDGNIHIRDVNSGAVLRTLTGHTSSVWAVAYSPSGKVMASGSRDRTVRLWDTATGDELHKLDGHTNMILSIVFAPDGKHVISASLDGTVRRWQTDSSSDHGQLLIDHASPVRSVCISPNGEILASGGDDKIIRFFNLGNGGDTEQHCMSTGEIRSLTFSPDGLYFASGSDARFIQIWDVDTYSEVRRLEGHTSAVLSLAFSFDGKLVVSSSTDSTVRLWDSQTGAELCTLNGHTSLIKGVVFTNNERRVISASHDGTCRVWSSSFPQIGPSYVPEVYKDDLSHPLPDGWIKTSAGELVLWVPSEYRDGIRDMSEICVPADAPGHPVRLDWSKLVKGDAWTSILKVEQT